MKPLRKRNVTALAAGYAEPSHLLGQNATLPDTPGFRRPIDHALIQEALERTDGGYPEVTLPYEEAIEAIMRFWSNSADFDERS